MAGLAKIYGPMVVAVLEGLRATVYPSYSLREFSQFEGIESSRVGWILGHSRETEEEEEEDFTPYLFVELKTDDEGHPVRFRCFDRHGREVETPRHDLSRESLIEALDTLQSQRPAPTKHGWRWLGQ